jgi:GTPase
MARKPMIVLASKMDVVEDPEKVQAIRQLAEGRGLPFYEISSVTGQGIEALKFILADRVLTRPGSGS